MKAENPLSLSSQLLAHRALPRRASALVLPLLLGLAACGGSTSSAPPPESAPAPAPAATSESASTSQTTTATPSEPAASSPALAASSTPSGSTTAPAPAKIDFPPNATVDQAIKAIPQGQPRMNMADDALRAPLLDLKRYDKCKIPRSTKVTMNVAVYDGAAVGADISSKPKNAKIEECVNEVVRGMSWPKVPSLNTVNANF
jgi:cytoskeletal protein RodZ